MPSLNYSMVPLLLCVLFVAVTSGAEEVIDLNRCLPDDLCQRFQCPPLRKSCLDGVVRQNASICGCCPVCVTLLDKGAKCLNLRQPLNGKKHQECRSGLKCNETTGLCDDVTDAPDMPSCLKLIKLREEITAAINFTTTNLTTEIWKPECQPDGSFKARQCNSAKCFCVAKDTGQRIFGQMEKGRAANMTCGCSRNLWERSTKEDWLTESELHCSSNGDFQELQCLGRICFCVDRRTGKQTSRTVKKELDSTLKCYKGPYLQGCEKLAITENKVIYSRKRKGVTIFKNIRKYPVKCDYTGNFGQKQCNDTSCHCTDENGKALENGKYAASSPEPINDDMFMSCQCARDNYEIDMKHAGYNKFSCDEKGSAKPFQVVQQVGGKSSCLCVDDEGGHLTEPGECHKDTKAACEVLVEQLRNAHKQIINEIINRK